MRTLSGSNDKMLLTIDIGNTSIHWGVFEKEILKSSGKIIVDKANPKSLSKECFPAGAFSKVLVSSVVPVLDSLILELFPKALFVTKDNIPFITIVLDSPEQVGADRLVDAVAVWKLFGGPAIIIDFGTATTFDLLSSNGEYLGGAIAPGLDLSRQLLHEKAAKLPLIDFAMPKQVIGKNTVEAMQSGLYYGYCGLVKELITQFKQVVGIQRAVSSDSSVCKVIATGGYASVVCKEIPEVEIIDELLSLKGLSLIAGAINQIP